MKSILFCLGLGLTISTTTYADTQLAKEEYVNTFRHVAIQQMIDNKIPASITIAQGILESASGNSPLAKKGNNHFGIKCHDWTGEKMYMDDDAAGECFRVYSNADESYMDHSKFLIGRNRYSKLFTFDIMDYKAWASGLKEAGYATNPKYPDMLIELIENLKLTDLDLMGSPSINKESPLIAAEKTSTSEATTTTARTILYISVLNILF